MAVTCSFKKKLAQFTMKESASPMDVWGGGNCDLVMTQDFGERRYLQMFISDSKHHRNLRSDRKWFAQFYDQFKTLNVYVLNRATKRLIDDCYKFGIIVHVYPDEINVEVKK